MESKSGNVLENTRSCSMDSVRVLMAYDGSGRRVSKTRMRKERDDENALNHFGARYLDPMLGLWISVDPKRQFSSPYLYVGNGMNPVNGVDSDGNEYGDKFKTPRAARNDFKKIYNTKSIKENVEYATLFYETIAV